MNAVPRFSLLTWNVNSIRARLDDVLAYVDEKQPDLVCLQEVKVEPKLFPRVPFLELGYQVTLNSVKGHAGVATLSRAEPDEVQLGFRDPPPDQHPRIVMTRMGELVVFNLYVPNGTAYGTEAFDYKLRWLGRLRDELDRHHAGEHVILCGDFNIIPEARDVWDVTAFRRIATTHYTDEEHQALAHLLAFGLRDCYRKHVEDGGNFTFYDYQHQSWEAGYGMRIDHVYASASPYSRCVSVVHDPEPRDGEAPSDHLPGLAVFD